MNLIYVFTLNGCVHCAELKNELVKENIQFHDIEISKNPQIWKSVVEQTGHDILPTVFIQKGEDGSGTIYTPGRDFQNTEEILKIIKRGI